MSNYLDAMRQVALMKKGYTADQASAQISEKNYQTFSSLDAGERQKFSELYQSRLGATPPPLPTSSAVPSTKPAPVAKPVTAPAAPKITRRPSSDFISEGPVANRQLLVHTTKDNTIFLGKQKAQVERARQQKYEQEVEDYQKKLTDVGISYEDRPGMLASHFLKKEQLNIFEITPEKSQELTNLRLAQIQNIPSKYTYKEKLFDDQYKQIDLIDSRDELAKGISLLYSSGVSKEEKIKAFNLVKKNLYTGFKKQDGLLAKTSLSDQENVTNIVSQIDETYEKIKSDFDRSLYADFAKATVDKLIERGKTYGGNTQKIRQELDSNRNFLGAIGNLIGVEPSSISQALNYSNIYDGDGKLSKYGQRLVDMNSNPLYKKVLPTNIDIEEQDDLLDKIIGTGHNLKAAIENELMLKMIDKTDEIIETSSVLIKNKSVNKLTKGEIDKATSKIANLESELGLIKNLAKDATPFLVNLPAYVKHDARVEKYNNVINPLRDLQQDEFTTADFADRMSYNPLTNNTLLLGIRNWGLSIANWVAKTEVDSWAKGIEEAKKKGLPVDPLAYKIYNEKINNYYKSYVFPTQDIIASAAAGRYVSSGEFIYRDKEGGFHLGSGFSMEGPGIIGQMVISNFLTAGIMGTAGTAVKLAASSASKAAKVAGSVQSGARAERLIKAVSSSKSSAQIWRNYIAGESAAANSWLARGGLKLLESRIPTFISVTASTYPGIYRSTLNDLYSQGLENPEAAAKTIATWSAVIEGLTEGFFPDIDYLMPKAGFIGNTVGENVISKFAGKKFTSLRDYMALSSHFDLSPASRKFLARAAFGTKKLGTALYTGAKLAKKIGFNKEEGFEEIVAELGNHWLNNVYADATLRKPTELDFDSILNAFVGGAFLTGPMAIPHLASYHREEKIQDAFRMALNPDIFRSKISSLHSQGKITQNQAAKALAQLEEYVNIAQSREFTGLVDEANYLDDRDSQYMYFRAKLNEKGVSEAIQNLDDSKISAEDKQKLIDTANEISKDIDKYERRSALFDNLTDEQKEARLMNVVRERSTKLPTYSLKGLRKLRETQQRQKYIAEINNKSVFPKIGKVMDAYLGSIDNAIAEREAQVNSSLQRGTLNPLMQSVYNETTSENVDQIEPTQVEVESIEDVAEMLLQTAINPDTSDLLGNLYGKIEMYREFAVAQELVTEQYLKNLGKTLEELDDPEEQEELVKIQERFQKDSIAAEQEIMGLIDALAEKFKPSILAGKVTLDEIENLFIGDSAQLFMREIKYFSQMSLPSEALFDIEEFKKIRQNTVEDRANFIKEEIQKEEEARRKEQAEASRVVPEVEEVEEEAPRTPVRKVLEVSPEMYVNLTGLTNDIEFALQEVLNAVEQGDFMGQINPIDKVLVPYILAAPNKEQALARIMFIETILGNTEVETIRAAYDSFLSGKGDQALRDYYFPKDSEANGVLMAIVHHFTKDQIEKFQEPIPETPQEIKEEEPKVVPSPPAPQPQRAPNLSGLDGNTLYAIGYSNRNAENPKSPEYEHERRKKNMRNTILKGSYKMRVMDLFSFINEFYPNGAERLQALQEVFNESKGSLTQEQKDKLREKFFANYPVELFGKATAEFVFNNYFTFRVGGLTASTEIEPNPTAEAVMAAIVATRKAPSFEINGKTITITGISNGMITTDNPNLSYYPSEVVSKLGLKIPKSADKFSDMNSLMAVAVTVDAAGTPTFARFDEKGNATQSGEYIYDTRMPRTEKSRTDSSELANKLRTIIAQEGYIDGIADITLPRDYTAGDASGGFEIGVRSVEEVIAPKAPIPSKVQEAPVPAAPVESSNVKPKKDAIEISKSKDSVNNTPILKSAASNFETLYIPRRIYELAYENDQINKTRTGGAQTLDKIIQRGGYTIEELNKLFPRWRDVADIERRRQEDLSKEIEGYDYERRYRPDLADKFDEVLQSGIDIADFTIKGRTEGRYLNGENQAYVDSREKNIKNKKKYIEINAKYDGEYVEAVKKGEMTKEQAMESLEKAGRKESAAYAELDALKSQTEPSVESVAVEDKKIEGDNKDGSIYKSTTTEKDGIVKTKYAAYKKSDNKKLTLGGRKLTKEEFLSEYKVDEDGLDLLEGVEQIVIWEIRNKDGKLGISVRLKFSEGWMEAELAAQENEIEPSVEPTPQVPPPATAEPSDVEANIADIERRRQEAKNSIELRPQLEEALLRDKKEFERTGKVDNRASSALRQMIKNKEDKIDKEFDDIILKEFGELEYKKTKILRDKKNLEEYFSKSPTTDYLELENRKKRLAKYDAELDALKSQAKPSVEPVAVEDKPLKVEVISENYTPELVRANPDKLFLFGDNNTRTGKRGQAVIRDEPNAIGISTKKLPNNTSEAFMSDAELASNKTVIDSDIQKAKQRATKEGKTIVLPKGGLGTGLAALATKAPQTFAYLNQKLQEEFGFINTTGELATLGIKEAPVSKVEEAKPTPVTESQFIDQAIDKLIKDSAEVPEPEGGAYTINGERYMRQSAYNTSEPFKESALTKIAVEVGDLADVIGRDILGNKPLKSKEEYLAEVEAKQNPDGKNPFYKPLEVSDEVFAQIQEHFQEFKKDIESAGGKIFTDKIVLHRKFKTPKTVKNAETGVEETFVGVAGVIDILIKDAQGNLHIIDMKTIKFYSASNSNAYDEFYGVGDNIGRQAKYLSQQSTYVVLAKGLLPKSSDSALTIKSIGIYPIASDYTMQKDKYVLNQSSMLPLNQDRKRPIKANDISPVVADLPLSMLTIYPIEADFEARNDINFESVKKGATPPGYRNC